MFCIFVHRNGGDGYVRPATFYGQRNERQWCGHGSFLADLGSRVVIMVVGNGLLTDWVVGGGGRR